ncbi:MAG: hypothetical protein GKS05_08810 [Nitrospirales bacterium]|nr:hypothetical protein [Nitrospirales bacterium]
MNETSPLTSELQSLEGVVLQLTTVDEVRKAVELAFDYRGDVTLELRSGESVEGYIFNRIEEQSEELACVFPTGQPGSREIPYNDICRIIFSGEDTADGKSWEAWVKKKQSQSS